MDYKNLGRTGLRVSVLGLGTMSFGPKERWFGGVDQKLANRLVGTALDAGVNLFDTADVYNIGAAEEMLGKALGRRRREAVVATKAFGRMGKGPNDEGLSRHHLLEACDDSLKRLGTDHIDLYQVHEFDEGTPLEETLRALEDLVRWGKVRYLGCSNFRPWQFARALGISQMRGWSRFETNQVIYNLLERGIEGELGPLCEDQGLGVLAFSPLAGGLLSGKYANGGGATGRHSRAESAFPPIERRSADGMVKVLGRMSKALGATPGQIALAWGLSRPWVSSVLFGATSLEQLKENLGAAGARLGGSTVELLDKASAAVREAVL